MNCKNCGYGLKQSCGDFEKIICTYEEGECVKITELEQENAELKENYFYTRCIRSNCPYIHKENRNCTKFGGFFTAVGNGDCPMMKNLNANIKLVKSKEIIKKLKALYFYPVVTKDDVKRQDEILAEAEQFLSEVSE